MKKEVSTLLLIGLCLLPLQAEAFTVAANCRHRSPTRLLYKNEKSPVDAPLPTEEVVTSDGKLKRTMETLTTTRPFPLFLVEKAAGTLEGTVKSITKPLSSRCILEGETLTQGKKKEHVVVLGVGWGAAALLKDLDTDIYDVTVISPRNQ